ncbi:MAG: ribbon-helix-helix domain-containing protein [Nitrososphaerota archaeon]|nr:ribbon-helix-helix domain-containing protein [Aigarchaeota archaeon]MDW8076070.1 ribbon-helix-helix domain-containing protein [Nitrososphaerota archaeon]
MTRYVTVKIPEEIGLQIDKVLYKAGYSSRAEFVKDAIRRLLEKFNEQEAQTYGVQQANESRA